LTFLKDKQASVQFQKVHNVLVAGVMRSGYSPFVRAAAFYRCAAPPHANDAPDSPKNIYQPAASHLFLSLPAIWRKCAFIFDHANQLPGILSTFHYSDSSLVYFCVTQKFISLSFTYIFYIVCFELCPPQKYLFMTQFIGSFHRSGTTRA
jgi:hypothetical protein